MHVTREATVGRPGRAAVARPAVSAFWHAPTGSVQYVVADPATTACAIIDPVLDFDLHSGTLATTTADALLAHVAAEGLEVAWILDTHPHADHVSAAAYLKGRTGAPMAIGEKVRGVQELWRDIYGLEGFATDGSQWDRLLTDGEHIAIGGLDCEVMLCAGHTLASVTYRIGDAAFIHDTLFMPDAGTARADFPGADPEALWRSIERILALPDDTRLFTGHDYAPDGRDAAWESTVAEQRAANAHLVAAAGDGATFVRNRRARDATLPLPKLLLAALQMNIRGGRPPEPDANGRSYLRIPLGAFGGVVV